ncbi:nitrate/nitrite transporter NrtS [Azoarcus sp. DN11]|uniref:nitrate/nitrite transporter NrtS n=1 Tax=Azoarcus sp. DN11 TaxID=356837 RepID=UPI000EB38B07|nr:nitrate/nitrite transporter NrtS [Azoarcus sp. DN11]AYH41917.1 hypothetical protein CDA09_00710 [Azoarcus sp. DN11]
MRAGIRGAWRHPQVIRRAARVAAVVGTALNLINHYGVLLAPGVTPEVMLQMALTYLVPYLVSTHGQIASGAEL